MTREEAKEVFLNRGFIDGIYDGDKWREACIVISKWLEQEPIKGHWITRPHIYGVAFCSECGFELKINNTNYCPNCGADMREVEE